MPGTSCFLVVFWAQKERNVRCLTKFHGKPLIIERQFSENVTVFILGFTLCVLVGFWPKTEQKVRF